MTFTALSIIQPWPWAILRPDVVGAAARAELVRVGAIKDCENRDWETPVRGWVLIHASSTRSAKWTYQAEALFCLRRGVEVPSLFQREALPYGAIVGAAFVKECTWTHRSPWAVGPRMFVFDPTLSTPFAEPVPCDGKPRFFQLPPPGAGVGGAELEERLVVAIHAAGLAAAFKIQGALA